MNKKRRKELDMLIPRIEKIKGELESLMKEEQEYFENMPENLYGSERHEIAGNAICGMEYAIDELENAISNIKAACIKTLYI